jgi:ABC-type Fe3+-hydroxamate transport system substrate-binding protein
MAATVFTDQCGNTITLSKTPKRIISLVPSQTELLFELGLEQYVIGITGYCVHPTHWLSEKINIGGTKNFKFDTIAKLEPDLIIGNKEENYREGIERLQQQYPVWVSDIYSIEDAYEMIGAIGNITDQSILAAALTVKIKNAFSGLSKVSHRNALYLIWRKPWMAAASNTFINSILIRIGLENAIATMERYPELTSEVINSLNPDIIFLSSEPYPFREKHIHELKTISPQSKIMLVDGEMFSWYGSRLQFAPGYFNSLRLDQA